MEKKRLFMRFLIVGLLASALTLGGCNDGDDGATGPQGPQGPQGEQGEQGLPGEPASSVPQLAVESCAVCHSTGKLADVGASHAITGKVTYTVGTPVVSGADLVITFNLKTDGVNDDSFVNVNRARRYYDSGVPATGFLSDDLATFVPATVTPVGGNYTVTIAGGAAFATTNSRYYFRMRTAAPARSASVVINFPATPRDLVSNAACINCHGDVGNGFHHSNPLAVETCVSCHSPSNQNAITGLPTNLTGLIHGIHNSHNMPSGHFVLVPDDPATPAVDESEIFSATYPSYMQNCSVCHNTTAGATAVATTLINYDFCLGCHENWTSFGDGTGIFATVNHNVFTSATVCTGCHGSNTVANFHNGLLTERSGLIYGGSDVSVDEGAKVDMQITGVSYSGTNLLVTWTASYDADGPGAAAPVAVDPCNTTAAANAPTFLGWANAATGQANTNLSILRGYGEGDDWSNNGIGTSPGQPVATNLIFSDNPATPAVETPNTVCAANVATSTIALTATEQATTATKGIVALQGKAQVKLPYTFDLVSTPTTVEARDVIQVRSKTPTYQFVVGTGVADTAVRRAIVDTANCLKCHVGSLYQHGGNRIDNVDMCVLCHNEASSEQNVRLLDGVDATEAYDGQVGQTYGFKSLLHAVHSSGETGKITMIYRTNGVYVWTAEGVTPLNWPGEGDQIVYGSNNVTRNHHLYAPTYPRSLNDCAACHVSGITGLPDQSKSVATTINAGTVALSTATPPTASNAINGNGNDDTLEGTAAAACMSCHQSGNSFDQAVLKSHAYQNGWIPTVFPEGRKTILDAAQ